MYHTPSHPYTNTVERKREKEIYSPILVLTDLLRLQVSAILNGSRVPSITLLLSLHLTLSLSLSRPYRILIQRTAQLPRNRNSLIDVVVCKLYRKNSFLSSRIIRKIVGSIRSAIFPISFSLFLSLSALPLHVDQSPHSAPSPSLCLSRSLSFSLFLSLCYSVGQWCLTGEERGGCAPQGQSSSCPAVDASALSTLSEPRNTTRAERVQRRAAVC